MNLFGEKWKKEMETEKLPSFSVSGSRWMPLLFNRSNWFGHWYLQIWRIKSSFLIKSSRRTKFRSLILSHKHHGFIWIVNTWAYFVDECKTLVAQRMYRLQVCSCFRPSNAVVRCYERTTNKNKSCWNSQTFAMAAGANDENEICHKTWFLFI